MTIKEAEKTINLDRNPIKNENVLKAAKNKRKRTLVAKEWKKSENNYQTKYRNKKKCR